MGDDDSSSASYIDQADVYEEGVESADCRKVVFNCLKNLEQKMNDLYMLANSKTEMQIKGDRQLINVTFSLEVLTSKFDELEKDRSRRWRCFVKKGVLKNFAKFTGKHLCQSLFFNKVAGNACNFIKKEDLAQVFFPVNFSKFSRTLFLQNTSGRLLLERKEKDELSNNLQIEVSSLKIK